jgi:hypothetical protein
MSLWLSHFGGDKLNRYTDKASVPWNQANGAGTHETTGPAVERQLRAALHIRGKHAGVEALSNMGFGLHRARSLWVRSELGDREVGCNAMMTIPLTNHNTSVDYILK